MTFYKLSGIGAVNSISTFTLDTTLKSKFKNTKPNFVDLPARSTEHAVKGIQPDSLGHFPIVIWNQGIECADMIHTIYILDE